MIVLKYSTIRFQYLSEYICNFRLLLWEKCREGGDYKNKVKCAGYYSVHIINSAVLAYWEGEWNISIWKCAGGGQIIEYPMELIRVLIVASKDLQ